MTDTRLIDIKLRILGPVPAARHCCPALACEQDLMRVPGLAITTIIRAEILIHCLWLHAVTLS